MDNRSAGGFVAPREAGDLALPDLAASPTNDLAGSERWRQRAQPVCGGLGGAGRNLDIHPARAVDAKNLAGDAALADDNRFLFGGAGLRFPDRFTPADDIRHNKLSTAIQPFHAPPDPDAAMQALSAPLS